MTSRLLLAEKENIGMLPVSLSWGWQGLQHPGERVPEPLCASCLMPCGEVGFKQLETWLFIRNSCSKNSKLLTKIKHLEFRRGAMVNESD